MVFNTFFEIALRVKLLVIRKIIYFYIFLHLPIFRSCSINHCLQQYISLSFFVLKITKALFIVCWHSNLFPYNALMIFMPSFNQSSFNLTVRQIICCIKYPYFSYDYHCYFLITKRNLRVSWQSLIKTRYSEQVCNGKVISNGTIFIINYDRVKKKYRKHLLFHCNMRIS